MTKLSPQQAARNRIAAARAARPKVDHNGKPTGPAKVYKYDEDGHLIAVEEASE